MAPEPDCTGHSVVKTPSPPRELPGELSVLQKLVRGRAVVFDVAVGLPRLFNQDGSSSQDPALSSFLK